MTDDPEYRVGYRNPPRKNQFKKGHSGHRPRKEQPEPGLYELMRERLKRKVDVTRGGRRERMSTAEALIERFVQSAMSGSDPNLRALLRMTDLFEPEAVDEAGPSGKRTVSFELNEEEFQALGPIRDELGKYLVPAPNNEESPPGDDP